MNNRPAPPNDRKAMAMVALALVVLALAAYRAVLLPGSVLMTTDDNIGQLMLRKSVLPFGFRGWWDDSALMGMGAVVNLSWTTLLLWLLPLRFFTNWIHALHLGLAAFLLALFLRRRGLGWWACLIGGVVAFWVGSNFTLTYAGHVVKFGVLVLAALYLWLTEQMVRTRRVSWAILAGGALGATFSEQADVALFFALFLFPYGLYAVVRDHGFNKALAVRLLAPLSVVAALVAFRPLWEGYRQNVRGVKVMDADSAEQWNFVTQWSWPPEESSDFVAPGFMGWRSGEPAGPYWGRMGRSAGWEQTKQGFRNFKLENQYLGAVAVVFALWPLWAALWIRGKEWPWRREVFWWGAVSLVTLLLSFGKFFPLYRAFYALPVVSSIRNPNKFLQVFQLALAIMTAYGVDSLFGARRATLSSLVPRHRVRQFALVVLVVGLVMGMWAFGASGSRAALSERFAADGWQPFADVIVANQIRALAYGAVALLCVAAILWAAFLTRWGSQPAWGRLAPCVLALLVGADVLLLSGHYVERLDTSLIAENDVTRYLKAHLGQQRVALVTQGGFYNAWLTYLFPYQRIPCINVTQMPRMPADYEEYLSALGGMPVRFWEYCAVGYILCPAQVFAQMQRDPRLKEMVEAVFAYNVMSDGRGGLAVVAGTPEQPGEHVICRFKGPAPRYVLIGGWESAPAAFALQKMQEDYPPVFTKVYVGTDTASELPPSPGEGFVGAVSVQSHQPGRVRLRVSTEKPAMLRVSDKYDPAWRASIGGQPVTVHRCDYLFFGVFVPAGIHEVALEYAPGSGPLLVQVAGLAACACAVFLLVLGRTRSSDHGCDKGLTQQPPG